MRANDLPIEARERVFVVGLYKALGLDYTPLRLLWDQHWSRAQGRAAWANRRDLCNRAAVPFSLTASYGAWDELPAEWRRRIEAAHAERRTA